MTGKEKSVVRQLIGGDFGLRTTYWGWGVIGGIILSGFGYAHSVFLAYLYQRGEDGMVQISSNVFNVLVFSYFSFILLSVISAAKQYSGKKVWAALACFFMAISALKALVPVIQQDIPIMKRHLVEVIAYQIQSELPLGKGDGVEVFEVSPVGDRLVIRLIDRNVPSSKQAESKDRVISDVELCNNTFLEMLLRDGIEFEVQYYYADKKLMAGRVSKGLECPQKP